MWLTRNNNKEVTKLWRKHGYGRLYWRSGHKNWKCFDFDDVAIARDGTLVTHFKSIDAIYHLVRELQDGIPF